jgi:hypothetical protein
MESQHQEKNSITPLDEQKLQQFLEKILSDVGGAASSILVYIGDKLGLLLMLKCELEYNDLSYLRIMIRIPFLFAFILKDTHSHIHHLMI